LADTVFGEYSSSEWKWQNGGIFSLEEGEITLAIKDLTGWYGRCDAILLTTDLDFSPPNEREKIEEFKESIGTLKKPVKASKYDVVVAGGGLAGISAALAASGLGCKVALIQNRPVLGGNAGEEIKVHVLGAGSATHSYAARETGIVEELKLEMANQAHDWEMGWPNHIFLDAVEKEENIDLFLDTEATYPIMEDNQIIGLKGVKPRTGENFIFYGKTFIDCTGDGTIGYNAGAEYQRGMESKYEFDEDLAPEEANNYVLGSTIMYECNDTGETIEFVKPPWARHFNSSDLPREPALSDKPSVWWIEYGGTLDTIYDAEEIRDELLRIVYGMWDYVKRNDKNSRNYELSWAGLAAGKRESRRLVGDYILNQNDLESATLFPDRVAYGGWPIDLHPPEGIYSGEPPCEQHQLSNIYSIPFRCLYSKNIENLMFAGRDISATHVALASTRVMGTCAVCGEVAGVASYLCKKYDSNPRDICKSHLLELQQILLKNGCYIPDLPNQDKEDLAREARIKASSRVLSAKNIINGIAHRGEKNEWISSKRVPQWIELSFKEPIEFNSVRIIFDTHLDGPNPPSPRAKECVRDYELLYWNGSAWVKILEVKDNYQRLRTHYFDPINAQKLRLKINAMNLYESGRARVYEIRIYNEELPQF
jgi:hypothetical protein